MNVNVQISYGASIAGMDSRAGMAGRGAKADGGGGGGGGAI